MYEIVVYILDHQQTYTREVITQQLLDAGHDREIIDEAFKVVNLDSPTRDTFLLLGFSETDTDKLLLRLSPKRKLASKLLIVIGIIFIFAGCWTISTVDLGFVPYLVVFALIPIGFLILSASEVGRYPKMTRGAQMIFIFFIVVPLIGTTIVEVCTVAFYYNQYGR